MIHSIGVCRLKHGNFYHILDISVYDVCKIVFIFLLVPWLYTTICCTTIFQSSCFNIKMWKQVVREIGFRKRLFPLVYCHLLYYILHARCRHNIPLQLLAQSKFQFPITTRSTVLARKTNIWILNSIQIDRAIKFA